MRSRESLSPFLDDFSKRQQRKIRKQQSHIVEKQSNASQWMSVLILGLVVALMCFTIYFGMTHAPK